MFECFLHFWAFPLTPWWAAVHEMKVLRLRSCAGAGAAPRSPQGSALGAVSRTAGAAPYKHLRSKRNFKDQSGYNKKEKQGRHLRGWLIVLWLVGLSNLLWHMGQLIRCELFTHCFPSLSSVSSWLQGLTILVCCEHISMCSTELTLN